MSARACAVLALAAAAAACARETAASAEPASARRALLDGAAYYERGDYALADRSWEDCLVAASPGSAEAAECRRRLERLLEERERAPVAFSPPSAAAPEPEFAAAVRAAPAVAAARAAGADPKAAMQAYLEGVIYYQNADLARAKESWTSCAELAGGDRATADDCRTGLQKLALDASTAPDGKK